MGANGGGLVDACQLPKGMGTAITVGVGAFARCIASATYCGCGSRGWVQSGEFAAAVQSVCHINPPAQRSRRDLERPSSLRNGGLPQGLHVAASATTLCNGYVSLRYLVCSFDEHELWPTQIWHQVRLTRAHPHSKASVEMWSAGYFRGQLVRVLHLSDDGAGSADRAEGKPVSRRMQW
ncbi:hypothetical protein BD413DRAFT_279539 [Trametes elegans]|nr:hypothetical protein BD413DRAFT_279539 [Trametes elegans]